MNRLPLPAQSHQHLTPRPGDYVRFTLERAFDFPLTIRLDPVPGRLCIAESTPWGKARTGPVSLEVEASFVDRIRRLVTGSYLGARPPPERHGLDGAAWKIEVQWVGEYHSSSVWSPQSGPEYELGRRLFRRAARAVPLGELY
ncbi:MULTISPECIES: hypothetical protein [Microbulbifer]|uniref:hypothetical protein n=1 Tax=Microbulbifer TaxID=48073 RepID=UPI001E4CF933|nr:MULTISPECIES: hypothetical protein [Microbulbifer]UHQ55203.1 hypothetical protein LVE68_17095 [Microbulbifer sp. YPW16]